MCVRCLNVFIRIQNKIQSFNYILLYISTFSRAIVIKMARVELSAEVLRVLNNMSSEELNEVLKSKVEPSAVTQTSRAADSLGNTSQSNSEEPQQPPAAMIEKPADVELHSIAPSPDSYAAADYRNRHNQSWWFIRSKMNPMLEKLIPILQDVGAADNVQHKVSKMYTMGSYTFNFSHLAILKILDHIVSRVYFNIVQVNTQ